MPTVPARNDVPGVDERRCTRCDVVKPLDDFSVCSERRLTQCKPCKVIICAEYRRDPVTQERGRIRSLRRSRVNKERVWDYLSSHPCVDCGEADPVVLEFDHVRGVKAQPIAKMLSSVAWERIAAEIEKCDVRCANCHRRKTAAERGFYAWRGRDHAAEEQQQLDALADGHRLAAM
jgi:hypothetical protein